MIEYLVDPKLQTSLDAFKVLRPPNSDYRELIRVVRVPTQLVIGERGVVSLDTAKELQRLNPLVCPELIADVGHGLPMTNQADWVGLFCPSCGDWRRSRMERASDGTLSSKSENSALSSVFGFT